MTPWASAGSLLFAEGRTPKRMSALKSFLAELRQRHVVRVAVVYVAVAWVLVETTATIFPTLGLPAWSVTLVVVMVGMGFPLALVLAWALELTPDGVRATESVAASPPDGQATGSRAGLAWLALLLPAMPGLLTMAAAFALLLSGDLWAVRRGLAPAWYPRLRIPLTTIVALCLLVAALG